MNVKKSIASDSNSRAIRYQWYNYLKDAWHSLVVDSLFDSKRPDVTLQKIQILRDLYKGWSIEGTDTFWQGGYKGSHDTKKTQKIRRSNIQNKIEDS